MTLVEILMFDGCPNVELAASRVRQAIANAGAAAEVQVVRIDGQSDAVAREFLGSPTVRIDGADVDASADARSDFGLQCRVYATDAGLEGAPPVAWIEAALRGVRVAVGETRAASCCGKS